MQRKPRGTIGRVHFVLLLLTALAFCGCNAGSSSLGRKHPIQVAGDVFIVTRGGVNYKLGLVRVDAIPEAAMEDFLGLCDEQLAIGRVVRDSLIRVKERELMGERANERSGFDRHDRLAERYRADEKAVSQADLDRAWNAAIASGSRQSKLRREITALKNQTPTILTPGYYFRHLPPGVAFSKTDADGKFTIRIPNEGRYALAAHSTRDVVGQQESYYWLTWIDARRDSVPRVMMSNDNLLTVPSTESVVLASENGVSPDQQGR